MADKPPAASGYSGGALEQVRGTCLYLATTLGDYREDIVVVGGLVPSLLIPSSTLRAGEDPHVGTMDLDVGLAVAVLGDRRYKGLAARLRQVGFGPEVKEGGRLVRQRWRRLEPEGAAVTVDFLIPPSRAGDRGGRLRHIERDFAAVVTPGLDLAFRDRVRVRLRGRTILGEKTQREIGVCGPAAFVVLKALAFGNRGENKDAYDLYYVIRHYPSGPRDIAERLRPHLRNHDVRNGLSILRRDFIRKDGPGPRRVAAFYGRDGDGALMADVAGFVGEFFELCRRFDREREE